jgi:hypothetical protein
MAKKSIKKNILNPDEILIAEFNYAKETAFQANQDRLALYNYFLSTGGALIAGLVFGNLDNALHKGIFITLFLGLAIWGLISYLKLLKIRIAWNSSILAMNQIKGFYAENSTNIDLDKAFRWTTKSKPSMGKVWTVSFLMGLMFAIVDSFSLGIAAHLLTNSTPLAFSLSLIFFLTHGVIWLMLLKD